MFKYKERRDGLFLFSIVGDGILKQKKTKQTSYSEYANSAL